MGLCGNFSRQAQQSRWTKIPNNSEILTENKRSTKWLMAQVDQKTLQIKTTVPLDAIDNVANSKHYQVLADSSPSGLTELWPHRASKTTLVLKEDEPKQVFLFALLKKNIAPIMNDRIIVKKISKRTILLN